MRGGTSGVPDHLQAAHSRRVSPGGIHDSNRIGGNAITDIIVYGRIAGANALADK